MAFEGISEWASKFSLDSLAISDPSAFLSIIYLALSIAIYSIMIWHFYRFVARRDCFKMSTKKHPKAVGFLKYFFAFPFVAFLFFLGFSLMMLFLTRNYEIPEILSISFALITAIRIAAYYNEDLSKDVAKMLPFALLGLFLVDSSYFRFEDIVGKIYSLPDFLTLCIQFILFIILIEWVLRILLKIRHTITQRHRHCEIGATLSKKTIS